MQCLCPGSLLLKLCLYKREALPCLLQSFLGVNAALANLQNLIVTGCGCLLKPGDAQSLCSKFCRGKQWGKRVGFRKGFLKDFDLNAASTSDAAIDASKEYLSSLRLWDACVFVEGFFVIVLLLTHGPDVPAV